MSVRGWLRVVVLLGGWVAAGAVQADQLAAIQQKGELVAGVLGSDEPNSYIEPDTRQFAGYEIDLIKAIAARLGVKPVFKQISVAARLPELQQGGIDIIAASLTHTRERAAQVDFSLTYFVTGQRVLVKKTSGIQSLSDLAGKKVLTVKGGTQGANVSKVVPTAQVVTFESSLQAFQALQQGKGAAFVNDEVSLLASYNKLGAARQAYVVLPQNLSVEYIGFGLRKGEVRLKQAVDQALRALEKSGEAEKIFMKRFGPQSYVGFDKRNFKIESDRLP